MKELTEQDKLTIIDALTWYARSRETNEDLARELRLSGTRRPHDTSAVRSLIALFAKEEKDHPLLPADWELRTYEPSVGDYEVRVPDKLREFALDRYESECDIIAIGSLNHEDPILFVSNYEDQSRLIADGWPPRFVSFLVELAEGGDVYIRLT